MCQQRAQPRLSDPARAGNGRRADELKQPDALIIPTHADAAETRSRFLVLVPVVCVRKVSVRVPQRFVPVAVAVRLSHGARVVMRVVFVVHVLVLMFQWFVSMHMLVALGQMQPYARGHEGRRKNKRKRNVFRQ